MDFSVSYHPISPAQMQTWYFDVFEDLGAVDELKVRIPQEQLKNNNLETLESFYMQKYTDMIKRSRDLDYGNFNKWHGYFIAIVQGFFEKFFFVHGVAISSITDLEFKKRYFTAWEEVVPSDYIEDLDVNDGLNGAFSAGIYISPTQVSQLLHDYEHDDYIKDLMNEHFEGRKVDVILAALKYAKQNNQGLVEAVKVIEQSEVVFEEPSCYSNLFNCDVMSAAVYTSELAEHYDSIYKGTGND